MADCISYNLELELPECFHCERMATAQPSWIPVCSEHLADAWYGSVEWGTMRG